MSKFNTFTIPHIDSFSFGDNGWQRTIVMAAIFVLQIEKHFGRREISTCDPQHIAYSKMYIKINLIMVLLNSLKLYNGINHLLFILWILLPIFMSI